MYTYVHTHTYMSTCMYFHTFTRDMSGTRAERGGGWRSGWKCEDGTRGGAAKVRECYINRSGQCCYGNTTHSHAVGWMGGWVRRVSETPHSQFISPHLACTWALGASIWWANWSSRVQVNCRPSAGIYRIRKSVFHKFYLDRNAH